MSDSEKAKIDRMERQIIGAMGSSDEGRPTRGECMHCRLEVVLIPNCDADAPPRWIHAVSRDYRCSLFATPATDSLLVQ